MIGDFAVALKRERERPSRELRRTEVPGIYTRRGTQGLRYYAIWRQPSGKQTKRSAPTLEEAMALRDRARAERVASQDPLAASFVTLGIAAEHAHRGSLGDEVAEAIRLINRARRVLAQAIGR